MTILSIFRSIPFDINSLFKEVFSTLISLSPNDDFEIFSFQCLLFSFNIKTEPIYVKMLNTIIFLVISFVIIILLKIFFERDKFKGNSIKRNAILMGTYFTNSFFIYFNDNLILLMNCMIPLIICINVGDEMQVDNRLLRAPYKSCWTNDHLYFIYFFVGPILSLFGVILPIFVFFQIRKAHRRGLTKQFLNKYAKFLLPYKSNRAYYEVFIILNKVIIVFFMFAYIYSN